MTSKSFDASIALSEAQIVELCETLDCDRKELAAALSPLLSAAMHEYVDMLTGVSSITTATDLRERRLVSIVLNDKGEIPSATKVARMFSITPTAAATLIRNVSAKHRVKISSAFKAALHAIVKNAKLNKKKKYEAVIRDGALVKLLNDKLAESEEPMTPVRLADDSLSRYVIDPGSRTYLLERLSN